MSKKSEVVCFIHHRKSHNFLFSIESSGSLTERATGAKRSIHNENQAVERLECLVPVIEEWHANVSFLKVSMMCLINHFDIMIACTM